MTSATSSIRISGLAKGKLAALRAQAKAAGVTAEAYARQLIEEGVALEREARMRTFDDLYAPIRQRFRSDRMSENDLAQLVDAARTRHHRRRRSREKA